MKSYLNACLRHPPLFLQSPDTIANNVVGLVNHDKLKDNNGLNILSLKSYINACLGQPPLFSQQPDTIASHFKALLFVNKDRMFFKQGNDIFDKDALLFEILSRPFFLSCTNKLNFSYLLREKMFDRPFPHSVTGNSRVLSKLADYLKKHPDQSFSFDIIQDDISKDFVEFANNFAKENTGKSDIFDINYIDMPSVA